VHAIFLKRLGLILPHLFDYCAFARFTSACKQSHKHWVNEGD